MNSKIACQPGTLIEDAKFQTFYGCGSAIPPRASHLSGSSAKLWTKPSASRTTQNRGRLALPPVKPRVRARHRDRDQGRIITPGQATRSTTKSNGRTRSANRLPVVVHSAYIVQTRSVTTHSLTKNPHSRYLPLTSQHPHERSRTMATAIANENRTKTRRPAASA